MPSLNKVTLMGHCGKDPETRVTAAGLTTATVSLATSERYQDKKTNEWKEATEWHRLVFFARQAEVLTDYVKKGDLIYVEGRIKSREWTDKEGKIHVTPDIIVSELKLLGGRKDNAQPPKQNRRRASRDNENLPGQYWKDMQPAGTSDDLEDDIDF